LLNVATKNEVLFWRGYYHLLIYIQNDAS
jgi:hypothetical protein